MDGGSGDGLATLIADAQAIAHAAVRGVQMDRLIARSNWRSWLRKPLSAYEEVRLLAIGKGAIGMAGALRDELGERLSEGLAIAPEMHVTPDALHGSGIRVMAGDHPVPGVRSAQAAEAALALCRRCGHRDLLLILLTGGGTSLAAGFPDEIPLVDGRRTFELLLRSGADIHAMNTVRRHITRLGGGGLARVLSCDALALVVSDVPGDAFAAIASGPTVPDPSPYQASVDILHAFNLWERVPSSVRRFLIRGANDPAQASPGPDASLFERVQTRLIGSNRDALEAASTAAAERGYRPTIRSQRVSGEARDVGAELAHAALETAPNHASCLLWGGETTVTVRGEGTGGRNQELALGASRVLKRSQVPVVLMSVGTDGRDGPTDAAGAWVSHRTVHEARALNLDPDDFLRRNDTYAFFKKLGSLLITGPTHTNVMDIQIVLIGARVL